MATTDARPGFKLPWGSDRSESDSTDAAEAAPSGTTEEPAATVEHADAAPEPNVNESTTDLAHRRPVAPEGAARRRRRARPEAQAEQAHGRPHAGHADGCRVGP